LFIKLTNKIKKNT